MEVALVCAVTSGVLAGKMRMAEAGGFALQMASSLTCLGLRPGSAGSIIGRVFYLRLLQHDVLTWLHRAASVLMRPGDPAARLFMTQLWKSQSSIFIVPDWSK